MEGRRKMADMNLSTWVYETFQHVTLSTEKFDPKSKGVIKIPEINRDLTVGLISTETIEEFRDLCFSFAPVGTIKDDLDPEWYAGRILRVRQMLTKMLVDEKNGRLAQKYLDILERRDRTRWAKDGKSVEAAVDKGTGELKIRMVGI
jgi:hypothetical protein